MNIVIIKFKSGNYKVFKGSFRTTKNDEYVKVFKDMDTVGLYLTSSIEYVEVVEV